MGPRFRGGDDWSAPSDVTSSLLATARGRDEIPSMGYPPFDYRHLPVHERLQLIGHIWDSIAEEAESDPRVLPLTDAQRAELDRRLAEHERDPGAAVSWEEALDGIQQRLRDARGER